ncbi:hypothetical protein ACLMAJ_16735 [Nocardia sp. KC 131]|uniref:hypothetical protein n=1 Tax=Nocardia arseniciresistens TaxID=3392119 RepID=UPI00398EC06F
MLKLEATDEVEVLTTSASSTTIPIGPPITTTRPHFQSVIPDFESASGDEREERERRERPLPLFHAIA